MLRYLPVYDQNGNFLSRRLFEVDDETNRAILEGKLRLTVVPDDDD